MLRDHDYVVLYRLDMYAGRCENKNLPVSHSTDKMQDLIAGLIYNNSTYYHGMI